MILKIILLKALLFISNVSLLSVDGVCKTCQMVTKQPGAYYECFNDINNSYSWCQRIYDFLKNNPNSFG